MRLICLLLLAAVSVHASPANKVSCKDEQGKDVDWWYMYKLPKRFNAKGQDASGQRYLYLTSKSFNKWQLSDRLIGDDNSMPGLTLEPLFADEKVLVAAYNDEFPNGTVSSTGGHTKGVVATDGVTGIWLVHSVPKYPTIPDYGYPSNGENYGQNLICLTLDVDGVEKVGQLLVYNEPRFYYNRNPLSKSSELFPSLETALNRKFRKEAPLQKEVKLTTADGSQFRIFGKTSKADVELYADVVAPALGANLYMEGWRNGVGSLPDSCDKTNKVLNVQVVSNPEYNVEFKTNSDHSKWAVSQGTGGGDWICVGDINRQKSQSHRGGGTICQENTRVSDNYRKLVAEYEKCN